MDKAKVWYNRHSDVPKEINNINKTMFPPEDENLVKEMHLKRW